MFKVANQARNLQTPIHTQIDYTYTIACLDRRMSDTNGCRSIFMH